MVDNMSKDCNKIVTASKQFRCSICLKIFRSKETLFRHEVSHSGIKPFVCNVCQYGFSSAVALKEHKAKHDNLKLYECNICDKSFRQNSSFHRHLLTHSKGTPHECKICHQQFSQKAYLRSHMSIHTKSKPYSCSECPKSFSHLSDLNRHKILHSGKKPYKCDVCASTFADRSSHRRHLKTHNNNANMCCQYCKATFKRGKQLKIHITKNHEKNSHSLLKEKFSFGKNKLQYIRKDSDLPIIDIPLENTSINNENLILNISSESKKINIVQKENSLNYANDKSILHSENEQNDVCNDSSYFIASGKQLQQHSYEFINHPDFNNQEYFNWLSTFTTYCKCLFVPIGIDIFKKISQVHKSLHDALVEPNAVLSKKTNFDTLLAICQDLMDIKNRHLKYIYEHLKDD